MNGPICVKCAYGVNQRFWDHDGECSFDVPHCSRLITVKTDLVTGERSMHGLRDCARERSVWTVLFWRDRCGPSGKYYTPKYV